MGSLVDGYGGVLEMKVVAYRCSVSKSRSFVRSTWPVFMRTWVVARLTPFLKPVSPSVSGVSWGRVGLHLTGPRHGCGCGVLLSEMFRNMVSPSGMLWSYLRDSGGDIWRVRERDGVGERRCCWSQPVVVGRESPRHNDGDPVALAFCGYAAKNVNFVHPDFNVSPPHAATSSSAIILAVC